MVEAVYKIAIAFEIRLAESGKVCTRGKSEQLCVKLPEMEMRFEVGALNNCVGLSQAHRSWKSSLW